MKKLIFLLLSAIAHSTAVNAQTTAEIAFEKNADTLARYSETRTYPFVVTIKNITIPDTDKAKYTVCVVAKKTSTVPTAVYSFSHECASLNEFADGKHTFYLTIDKDVDVDRLRTLNLNLEIKKEGKNVPDFNSAANNTTLNIAIKSARVLNKYNYLGYVGTNFDLVDGIQAKNLFFATNLFAPPQHAKQGFGFNLTLYGNRSLTTTDTSGRVTYASKISPIGGDSARTYYEEALKTVSRVSDNLGATFSPLIRLGLISNPERKTQIYYAPQFEFIWRRTKITTTYTDNVVVDSTDRAAVPISSTLVLTKQHESLPFNIYDVYLGLLGVYLNHENEHISIRIQGSFGGTFRYTAKTEPVKSLLNPMYDRQFNFSCFVRAWITEPQSGLTFGAEVTNNVFNSGSYQPYYNVTLSKAINLNALGAIFSPLTTRS